jgi:hypothetical protein
LNPPRPSNPGRTYRSICAAAMQRDGSSIV